MTKQAVALVLQGNVFVPDGSEACVAHTHHFNQRQWTKKLSSCNFARFAERNLHTEDSSLNFWFNCKDFQRQSTLCLQFLDASPKQQQRFRTIQQKCDSTLVEFLTRCQHLKHVALPLIVRGKPLEGVKTRLPFFPFFITWNRFLVFTWKCPHFPRLSILVIPNYIVFWEAESITTLLTTPIASSREFLFGFLKAPLNVCFYRLLNIEKHVRLIYGFELILSTSNIRVTKAVNFFHSHWLSLHQLLRSRIKFPIAWIVIVKDVFVWFPKLKLLAVPRFFHSLLTRVVCLGPRPIVFLPNGLSHWTRVLVSQVFGFQFWNSCALRQNLTTLLMQGLTFWTTPTSVEAHGLRWRKRQPSFRWLQGSDRPLDHFCGAWKQILVPCLVLVAPLIPFVRVLVKIRHTN